MTHADDRWSWERPDDFPTRVRFLRESFGLSAKAAAMACGLDDQAWRNWENRVNGTSKDTIATIAARFEGRPGKSSALAGWLIVGGSLPERPQPPFPFTTRRKTSVPDEEDAGSYTRSGGNDHKSLVDISGSSQFATPDCPDLDPFPLRAIA